MGSSSRVAPKKIKAPDKGLTIEKRAPNANKKVAKSAYRGANLSIGLRALKGVELLAGKHDAIDDC